MFFLLHFLRCCSSVSPRGASEVIIDGVIKPTSGRLHSQFYQTVDVRTESSLLSLINGHQADDVQLFGS